MTSAVISVGVGAVSLSLSLSLPTWSKSASRCMDCLLGACSETNNESDSQVRSEAFKFR